MKKLLVGAALSLALFSTSALAEMETFFYCKFEEGEVMRLSYDRESEQYEYYLYTSSGMELSQVVNELIFSDYEAPNGDENTSFGFGVDELPTIALLSFNWEKHEEEPTVDVEWWNDGHQIFNDSCWVGTTETTIERPSHRM